MSAPNVIFIDEAEFGLAAYDADDGLTKQVALRFTARGGTLCDDVEDADYVIINKSKSDWRSVFRRYVSGNRIALSSDWIDACVRAGHALLEGDQYGGFRLQLHDALPGPEHRTPLPTPRTTPTSSAPLNMHASYQSPHNQPTPGPSASPTGQQYTPVGTFPQAGPSSGHFQGQSPVAASFPQQNGYTGGPNPLAPQIASLFQGFMNQPQQHGNPPGQVSYSSYPQSQPISPQLPQTPGQYQNPNVMPQPTLPPQFMQQLNAHLLQQQQLQQAQAAQVQQELQGFDLNNPYVVDTLMSVARHSNNLAALYALQSIRACQPAMQAAPPAFTSPPSVQHTHTAYSPVEDDAPASPVPSTRKRKSEQMAMDDDDDAPVAPRKAAKKPSITLLAKDKGKQKATPTARPSGPTSRKMASSSDLRGEASGSSESKPAVKQEKRKIFTNKNGTPMSVYVLDQLYNKQKRAANLTAVKAHGGRLVGAGGIEGADFCVFDRNSSKDYLKMYNMAVDAGVHMVNADYVLQSVEAGKRLRYPDFPVPTAAGPSTEKRRGKQSDSFFSDAKPTKGRQSGDFDDEEDEEETDESSNDEPAPRKPKTRASTSTTSPRAKTRASGDLASSSSPARNAKGFTTAKSAKEQSAVKQPKLIRKPKSTAQTASKPAEKPAVAKPAVAKPAVAKPAAVTSAAKPSTTTEERDSPNPPPAEKFDGKRFKFTDEELEWAWSKLARMAQKDDRLTLAKACEGLANRTPHHSASSWRGRLERELDKFDEIIADANPSKTGARKPVSSSGSGIPPKIRTNSSSSLSEATATTATAQPMQVDEPVQPSQPNNTQSTIEEHGNEHPIIQPDEEDDFQLAVTFLTTYDPADDVVQPGDERIWPVLNRKLGPCKSQPSWEVFWEKYESSVLDGVNARANAANGSAASQTENA